MIADNMNRCPMMTSYNRHMSSILTISTVVDDNIVDFEEVSGYNITSVIDDLFVSLILENLSSAGAIVNVFVQGIEKLVTDINETFDILKNRYELIKTVNIYERYIDWSDKYGTQVSRRLAFMTHCFLAPVNTLYRSKYSDRNTDLVYIVFIKDCLINQNIQYQLEYIHKSEPANNNYLMYMVYYGKLPDDATRDTGVHVRLLRRGGIIYRKTLNPIDVDEPIL